MKKALITGVTGQDGSYLAEFLLNKGYEVYGLVRRSSLEIKRRINHLYKDPHIKNNHFKVKYGDMTDSSNLIRIIQEIKPDEIYNLAAQSHVKVSFEIPEYTANADAIGPLRILEAIRILNLQSECKFYQASTSELFGKVNKTPQNEDTPFYPRSPYAAAKLYAHSITVNYREAYNIYASNGILFNHESPRRGNSFVSKKIAISVAKIVNKKQDILYLGNLDAKRDWGYAPDYVEAMWKILQYHKPDDFVIATGETHTVREFVEEAFNYCNVNIEWKGSKTDEIGIDIKTGKKIIKIDPWYFRPTEVDKLIGDYKKAERELKWKPKVKFKEVIKIMMEHELKHIGEY